MTKKYSDDVQNILTAWLEEIQKLADEGKVHQQLAENIQNLIQAGDIEDIKKIRFAIENGVKNFGAN